VESKKMYNHYGTLIENTAPPPSPQEQQEQYKSQLALLSEEDQTKCVLKAALKDRNPVGMFAIGLPISVGMGWFMGWLVSLPASNPNTKRMIKMGGAVIWPALTAINAFRLHQSIKATECPTPPPKS